MASVRRPAKGREAADQAFSKPVKSSRKLMSTIGTLIIIPSLIVALCIYLAARYGVLGETISGIINAPGVSFEALAVVGTPILASLLAGIIAAVLTRKRNNRYMKTIADTLKKNVSGEYTRLPEMISVGAELDMRVGLSALIEKNNAMRIALSKAEPEIERLSNECDRLTLNLMSARIMPSFSTRALSEINRLIKDNARKGAPIGENSLKIARLSAGLNELLMSAGRDAAQPVSLAGEISLVRLYLDMMELLTGEKIKCKLSVMCSIVDYKIAPNLILPVLENFFDLAQRDGVPSYTMSVEVNSSPSGMKISIIDNGRGIVKTAYQKITKEIQSDSYEADEALSLPGINHRIGILYGRKYGIRLDSSKLYSNIVVVLPPVDELN